MLAVPRRPKGQSSGGADTGSCRCHSAGADLAERWRGDLEVEHRCAPRPGVALRRGCADRCRGGRSSGGRGRAPARTASGRPGHEFGGRRAGRRGVPISSAGEAAGGEGVGLAVRIVVAAHVEGAGGGARPCGVEGVRRRGPARSGCRRCRPGTGCGGSRGRRGSAPVSVRSAVRRVLGDARSCRAIACGRWGRGRRRLRGRKR